MRGPNWEEARVRATMVIEKVTPATLIAVAAMIDRTSRAPSAPPGQIHPSHCAELPGRWMASSSRVVIDARPTAASIMAAGTNQ
jgi:hypothetical protein